MGMGQVGVGVGVGYDVGVGVGVGGNIGGCSRIRLRRGVNVGVGVLQERRSCFVHVFHLCHLFTSKYFV